MCNCQGHGTSLGAKLSDFIVGQSCQTDAVAQLTLCATKSSSLQSQSLVKVSHSDHLVDLLLVGCGITLPYYTPLLYTTCEKIVFNRRHVAAIFKDKYGPNRQIPTDTDRYRRPTDTHVSRTVKNCQELSCFVGIYRYLSIFIDIYGKYRPKDQTNEYRQIPTNTDKYRQIPTNTDKYWPTRQIPANTNRYRQIPTNTDKYRQILTCRGLSEFFGDLRYMPPCNWTPIIYVKTVCSFKSVKPFRLKICWTKKPIM